MQIGNSKFENYVRKDFRKRSTFTLPTKIKISVTQKQAFAQKEQIKKTEQEQKTTFQEEQIEVAFSWTRQSEKTVNIRNSSTARGRKRRKSHYASADFYNPTWAHQRIWKPNYNSNIIQQHKDKQCERPTTDAARQIAGRPKIQVRKANILRQRCADSFRSSYYPVNDKTHTIAMTETTNNTCIYTKFAHAFVHEHNKHNCDKITNILGH